MLFVLAFAFIITICGTASAATPQQNTTITSHNNSSTLSTLQTNSNVKKTVSKGDPIINGTVTINEYGAIRNLSNATVTVNSNSGRTLAITTTDAKGYYSVNFYSTDTQFKITTSYLGCNAVTNTVNVKLGTNPGDPNYYGTSNSTLTPKQAWWNGNYGSGSNIYITHYGNYNFAGEIITAVDGTSTTYTSYCIDIYTMIYANDKLLVNGPLPGTAGNLSSQIDWGAVNYVINHYSPASPGSGLTSNQMGAAIQSAIWALTTVQYPNYNPSNSSAYYHFLTAPNDALDSSGGTAIRTEALAIASYASSHSMVYPSTINLSPKITRIANGQPATITATVLDNKGNPLSGATVNFQTTGGKLSSTTGVTNSNGQVIVTLSNIPSSTSVTVTASVSGNYGNLLYDNPLDPRQNLVAENILPQIVSDISIINSDVTANVALSQTVNSPVNVGNKITYTVTATNNGPNTATGIVINDVLPSGFTATPSAGTYYNGQWVISSLTSGSSATLTINGIATAAMAGTNIINTATETGQDQYNSQSPTSTASSYVNDAVLTISNTGTTPVNVGDTGKFTITATNNGPDTANNIQINDPLPTGFTYSATAGIYNSTTGIWTINSLASSGTATLTFTGPITTGMAGTTITNHATATWTEYPSKVTIPDSTINVNKMASIAITNTGTTPVNVGQTGTFTVTAINNGPNAANNIQINDPTPTGFTFGTPTVGTYNAATGIWTINSLTSGATATLTFTKTNIPASMAGTTTTNTATATWTEYPSTVTIPNSTIHVNQAGLTITNTGTTPVNVGDTGTFTITATNNGPDAATNIKIKDLIPNGFTATNPTAGTYDGTTWTINSLANGATATLTFTKNNIPASMAGTTTTNTATATWTEYPSTVTIPNSTIYVKQANVALSQTGNYSGNIVTFIVTATNNGPDTATNINIKDLIPTGLTNVTVTPSLGTSYSNGVWTIPSLTYLATATLNITGNGTVQKTFYNNATKINQTEYDPNAPETTTYGVYVPSVNIGVFNTPWYYLQSTQKYLYKYVMGNTPVFMWNVVNSSSKDEATGVISQYIIPKGFQYVGSSTSGDVGTITYNYDAVNQWGILTWNIGYMPQGGSVMTYVTLRVNEVGNGTADLTTIANLTHVDQTDSNRTNDQNITCPIEVPPSADTQVNQTYTTYTQNNKTYAVYTITVKNNGPSNATGVQITDILPSTVKWVSDTSGGLYNNNIWNIGNITSGDTKTLNITVQITGTGTIINTAKRTAQTESDINYNNNAQTTYITISGTYKKTVNIGVFNTPWYYLDTDKKYLYKYVMGNTPVFMWNVVNSSSKDEATGVISQYIIPKGFQYVGSSTSGDVGTITYNYDAVNQWGILTWNIGYMPQGGSVMTYVTLRVNEVGNGTADLTTIANLTHVDQTDSNRTNDQNITCPIEVPPSADTQVNQTYTTYTQNNKTYAVYTITVKNNGPSNATGVQITDILPSTVKWDSDTSGGYYNPNTTGTGAGIWNIGTINSGDTKTLNITVQITGTGTIINTAKRTAQTESDINYNNNAQTTYITT